MPTLSPSTKITLGTVASVIVFCFAVVQPLAGKLIDKMLTDVERSTRVDMKLESHEKSIEEIKGQMKYVYDAMQRVEGKLGTLPSQSSPKQ